MVLNKIISKVKLHNFAFYLSFALGLITQIFLVRQLELEVYGEYVIILSILGVSQFIIQSSSQEIYIRRKMTYSKKIVRSEKADTNTELSIVSVCGFVVFLYMENFIKNPNMIESLIAVVCVFSNYRIGSAKSWYLINYRVPELNYLELFFALSKLLITIFIVTITHDMYVLITNILFLTVIQNAIFHLGIKRLKLTEDKINRKKRAQHGLFYTVSRSSLTQGLFEADIILFANILSPRDLAILRIAKTLSQFIVVLIAPLWRNMQPEFIHTQDKTSFIMKIIKCHRISIIVLAFVVLITFAFGEPLVNYIYNVEFNEGLTLLIILLLSKYLFFTTNSWYRLWAITCTNQIVTLMPGLLSIMSMFLFAELNGSSQTLSSLAIILLAVYFLFFSSSLLVFRFFEK